MQLKFNFNDVLHFYYYYYSVIKQKHVFFISCKNEKDLGYRTATQEMKNQFAIFLKKISRFGNDFTFPIKPKGRFTI